MVTSRVRIVAVAIAATAAMPLAGCGDGGGEDAAPAAGGGPDAAEFPDPEGAPLDRFLARFPDSELVVSPAGQVLAPGSNRFGFGVFTIDRTEVDDAEVALYAARGPEGATRGPYPARIESLETDPAFRAQNTAEDPDAASVVYVSELRIPRPGEWRLAALTSADGELAGTRLPSVVARPSDPIPAPGERPPAIHTPTVEEVGEVGEIDTRVPPSTMHEHDFAEVLGTEPVVLLFATPALCQSRVCGPVVDIAEQVKRERGEDAAFIYSEIYRENDPGEGLRPQVREFNLPTEPWLFVIDEDGRVRTRIEGAFSASELEGAVDRVVD